MRTAFCWLALWTAVAGAEPSLTEFGTGARASRGDQVVEASCDLHVELRGAIAEIEQTHRFVRGAPSGDDDVEPVGVIYEFELPAGAQLVAASARVDRTSPAPAVFVAPDSSTSKVESGEVLGADPVWIELLQPDADGRDSYRAIVQGIEPQHEVALIFKWTAVATIRDHAIRTTLPGRPASTKLATCRGTVRATPGPGATVANIRVVGQAGPKGTFVLADTDVTVDAELAFAKPEPIAWTQTEPLGDGWTAQAVTVIAPPIKATPVLPRRAVVVIDSSRSMELVGKHNVGRLLRAIGNALPNGTEVEAILYDRTPTRVFGGWQPAVPATIAAIESMLAKRSRANGSDAGAAFALAHRVIADGSRGQAMVILISDGVFGGIADAELARSFNANASELDLHAIILDPGSLESPGPAALKPAIDLFGGTYVEVGTRQIDQAIGEIESWLRPSWRELTTPARIAIPDQLRAGTGVVTLSVTRKLEKITLHAREQQAAQIVARPGPTAAIARLALVDSNEGWFVADPDHALESDHAAAAKARQQLLAKHRAVDEDHALVVLTQTGRVARTRSQMVAGGGPFTRMILDEDPERGVRTKLLATVRSTPIDRVTLERTFRDQLRPRAYACYQKALAKNGKLEGEAKFDLDIGRGEVTRVQVTGLGDAAFDACLETVAYSLELDLPNPDTNTDDRTIARYPLKFSVHEQKPLVVAGDADSESPLDIDAIQGGPPRVPVRVDASTPLGGLRPTP